MSSERCCPLCGSGDLKQLFSLQPDQAGKLLIPDDPARSAMISNEISKIWEDGNGAFVICRNCQYGFAWPFQAGNEAIYSILYDREFSYPDDKWEYNKAIDILLNLNITGDSTLLEPGAGNGAFLEKASLLFPGKQHIFSTEYAAAGVEEIRRKGFNCYNRDITTLHQEKIPGFDIICMFQVLEHMDNLQEIFHSLNRLSNPGAHLMIAVPNGRLRSFYDKWGVHLDVPPIHVGRFREKTFAYIGRKFGWNIMDISIEAQHYPEKVNKFLYERFNRLIISEKVPGSNNRLIMHLFRYGMKLLLAVRYLPVMIYLLFSHTGTSLLVHFQKQPGSK